MTVPTRPLPDVFPYVMAVIFAGLAVVMVLVLTGVVDDSNPTVECERAGGVYVERAFTCFDRDAILNY